MNDRREKKRSVDETGISPAGRQQSCAQAEGPAGATGLCPAGLVRRIGMMGLVGWSVVLPTVLGAALGVWLDRRYPMRHSWTLTLLFTGLFVGCLNAWHWVAREDKETHKREGSGNA